MPHTICQNCGMFRSSSYHPQGGLSHTNMYKACISYQIDYLQLRNKTFYLFDNSSMPVWRTTP
jgi:hypothetical protein